MRRVLRVVLGFILLLAGVSGAALGGLGIATFGRDGVIEGQSQALVSADRSAALIADLEGVSVSLPMAEHLGVPALRVTGDRGAAIFVGVGPQASVDAFLFGVPYDIASHGDGWSTTSVPGIEPKAPDPATESFWSASAQGVSASVDLSLGDSPGTLVVMNADGAPAVSARAALEFRAPRVFGYSIAAIGVGAVLIAVGLVLIVRRPRRAPSREVGRPAGSADLDGLLREEPVRET